MKTAEEKVYGKKAGCLSEKGNAIFRSAHGEVSLEVKKKPLSIFDTDVAGQFDVKGDYYVWHRDHKTHEFYVVRKEDDNAFRKTGHRLDSGEAVFNGERVRVMTFEEECLWNEDRLLMNVDLWGNVAVDEPFDMEWYMEHCI